MADKDILYRNLNEGIILERRRIFEKNLGKNLHLIEKHGGLKSAIPFFNAKNVIVIGAGPSLEKNCELIRKYQHRHEILLVSTDMALRPLVKSGIRPYFVISCETNPVGFFHGIDTSGMHLLAFSCMSNINLRQWRGKISFYNWMHSAPEFSRLWDIAGKELGFVPTGGIVTTQAVSIALGCGIASLILVGNDLAFGSGFYSRGSVWHCGIYNRLYRCVNPESEEINISRRRRGYEIRRGNRVFYTDNQFYAAKTWLEELFQKEKKAVYDCSDPGCSEKYVEKKSLIEVIHTIINTRRKRRSR